MRSLRRYGAYVALGAAGGVATILTAGLSITLRDLRRDHLRARRTAAAYGRSTKTKTTK